MVTNFAKGGAVANFAKGAAPNPKEQQLPSLTLFVGVIFMSVAALLYGVYYVVFVSEHLPYAVFALIAILGMLAWSREQYRQRLQRRYELRAAREKALLDKEWIPNEPIDWVAIERAMDELMAAGIEPTYERARGWLSRHEEQARYESLVERAINVAEGYESLSREAKPCEHQRIECFDVDHSRATRMVCIDCGADVDSPFHHPKMDDDLLR